MYRLVSTLIMLCSGVVVLSGCSKPEEKTEVIRPALAAQPLLINSNNQTFPGEVRARYEPELAFRIAGKVSKRLVDVGARVKKDQVLAVLDPQDVNLHLESANAQLAAAQANVKLLKTERDRYQALVKREMASQSAFDTANTQYQNALAQLKQAQAQHNVAKNQISYTQLTAPSDGVITVARVESGQVVGAGQTVFVLAQDGEREIAIGLPEQLIEKFKVGNAFNVQLWSQPDQTFSGVIREVSPAADPRSRTYAARIALVHSDTNIHPELGQSAKVFAYSTARPLLSVPLSALTAEDGKPFVWVLDPTTKQAKQVFVTVDVFGSETVPILSGLDAQDWVVIAGVHLLQKGQQVQPIDRHNKIIDISDKE
ncbi:efflux RND transporter periplasmic adaptor subunit [Pseudomonas sp. F1_0610]|uniref:efflux RND transporter periplasmic adaptor subunit n=1 Tax=Pseudomonas sp. F1_0610 TaxID=3114284 RepID=UPI0039C1EC8A